MNDVMVIATLGVLIPLFLAYSIFAYRYFRYSPWNSTWQGITLEAQKVTLAALVGFYIADTIIGGYWPGRYSILLILLTLLLVEAWATLWGLLVVQRAKGKVSQRKGSGYVDSKKIKDDPGP